ncbi:MAG: hypothetical protein ABH804_00025, partial [archaeon]
NPTGNERGYKIDFLKLCEILIKQEWLSLENIENIVSVVSECKYNKETIREWFSDTFLTPDTLSNNSSDTLTDTTPNNGLFNDSGIGARQ